MLLQIDSFSQIDGKKLMDIYREGNEENIDYFYPDMSDQVKALELVENSFLNYIQTDFLSKGSKNRYMVLETNGIWMSALRLYFVEDGLYYIEALETHPDYRKRGYAAKLLSEVVALLKESGPFRLCDCVSKKNVPSLATHKKCGFQIARDPGYDYLQNEVSEHCYGMEYAYQADESIQSTAHPADGGARETLPK